MSYRNHTPSNRTRPSTWSGAIATASGESSISGSRSRYSKIRSNNAIDEWISVETCSIDPIGKNRRDWSVVKATIVPAVIVVPVGSRLITQPATR